MYFKQKRYLAIIALDLLILILIFKKFSVDVSTNRNVSNLILVVVISEPKNQARRQAIRDTWGNNKTMKTFNATLVFFMGHYKIGRSPNLVEESKLHGDLIFGDFYESYINLRIKSIEALKLALNSKIRWASYNFTNFNYFVKVDDDVLFNIEALALRISHFGSDIKQNGRFLFCFLMKNNRPIRENSKWKISFEEYPFDQYPPFCSGTCYVLTKQTVDAILEVCKDRKLIHLEDVAVTGICGEEARVQKHRVEGFIIHQDSSDICLSKNAISHHLHITPERMREFYYEQKNNC